MSDGVSGHQGIFLPLAILAVVLMVVFAGGVATGWFICYLTA